MRDDQGRAVEHPRIAGHRSHPRAALEVEDHPVDRRPRRAGRRRRCTSGTRLRWRGRRGSRPSALPRLRSSLSSRRLGISASRRSRIGGARVGAGVVDHQDVEVGIAARRRRAHHLLDGELLVVAGDQDGDLRIRRELRRLLAPPFPPPVEHQRADDPEQGHEEGIEEDEREKAWRMMGHLGSTKAARERNEVPSPASASSTGKPIHSQPATARRAASASAAAAVAARSQTAGALAGRLPPGASGGRRRGGRRARRPPRFPGIVPRQLPRQPRRRPHVEHRLADAGPRSGGGGKHGDVERRRPARGRRRSASVPARSRRWRPGSRPSSTAPRRRASARERGPTTYRRAPGGGRRLGPGARRASGEEPHAVEAEPPAPRLDDAGDPRLGIAAGADPGRVDLDETHRMSRGPADARLPGAQMPAHAGTASAPTRAESCAGGERRRHAREGRHRTVSPRLAATASRGPLQVPGAQATAAGAAPVTSRSRPPGPPGVRLRRDSRSSAPAGIGGAAPQRTAGAPAATSPAAPSTGAQLHPRRGGQAP